MPPTLKILIASPADVLDARKEAELQVELLNEDPEIAARYRLEVIKWEEVTPPFAGRPPQETVNEYMGRASQCDIVVCIFGRRFGTEAVVGGRLYPSGTYYEFISAYKAYRVKRTGKPVILLYRMHDERPPVGPEEVEQAEKVEAFFKRFHGRDPVHLGLCKDYAGTGDFGAALSGHLRQVIIKEFPRQKIKNRLRALMARLSPEPDYPKERKKMLGEVRRIWIDEVLNDMAPPVATSIDIGIRLIGEPTAQPGEKAGPAPQAAPRHNVRTLFDNVAHQLVIVGEPGGGKTFKMLELLRDLLGRAREHGTAPIPVVFNLSSWADSGKPMAVWLIDELTSVYGVSHKLARHWVDGEHLALLLDGLDEITAAGAGPGSDLEKDARSLREYCRRKCLDELNDYIAGSAIWMVLCCRKEEYAALGTRLLTRRVNATAEIEPLSDEEVQTYLDEAGPELASLNQAVAVDGTLRDMARTPFLLVTMSTAYEEEPGMSAKEIIEGGGVSREDRLKDMFERFISTRHKRVEAAGKKLPSLPHTRFYLGVLAQKMEEGDAKIFFVDQLQPDHIWLSPGGRRQYRALTAAFLLLFIWLLVGLPSGWALGYELAEGNNIVDSPEEE